MLLWIVLGIFAVGLGVYLGLPGDSRESEDEAIDAIERGRHGHRRKVKKVFTPLDLLRARKKSQIRAARRRQPFRTAASRGWASESDPGEESR